MKKKYWLSFAKIGICFVLLFLGGKLASAEENSTPAGQPATAEKEYVIATDLTFPPFEFQNDQQKYVGIDIDLVNRIAEMKGFKVKFNPVGFNAAIQAVEANQADAMIAGMTITDERKQSFDFSDPYFDSGIQLAVKKGDKDIKDYKDLKGKLVGAKIGTESAEFLNKNADKYGYTVKVYNTANDLYNVLNTGYVAAIMDDYPVLSYNAKQGQAFELIGKPEMGGQYGFAVKKGTHPELLKAFNEGLADLKASGEYQKILNKYLDTGKTKAVDHSFFGLIKSNYRALLKGLGMTMSLVLISFVLAMIIGALFGIMSVSQNRLMKGAAGLYVDLIRGVPLMVLAFFIFLGIPNVTGLSISDYTAGIITLTLNASAYIAEIFRGGIQAVPIGQTEASRSLGFNYSKTMRKIILPQAIKIMIPSLINQFVISLKDTTILSAIGLVELLQTGQIIIARTAQSFKMLLIISLIYLIVITILTKLSKRLEKKVNVSAKA